jgi:exodeoxyribonuclease VII small subunit
MGRLQLIMTKKKEYNFEASIKRLQEISDLLENGDIGLEDSIKLYEEGINLTKICYSSLKEAELKVTEIKRQLESDLKENK